MKYHIPAKYLLDTAVKLKATCEHVQITTMLSFYILLQQPQQNLHIF